MRRLILMQAELESSQLVTVLAPSKRHDRRDWDQIRCNVSVPPKWYRRLCNLHVSKRGVRRGKFDTKIRRRETIIALQRMIAGSRQGIYEERILAILK